MLQWTEGKRLRILDWDIENRPINYMGGDFTGCDITAIAASWVGEKKVHCWALGEVTTEEMLLGFCELYDQADVVTGHYIRNHDLPITNGALMEFHLPLLSPKLTCDTKNDLIRRKDVSASQESLAQMLGVPASKYHMTQPMWRAANRLEPDGITLTRKRVIDDVIQHKALREALLAKGMLKPPRVWHP
jgi:hypothetical protein